MATEVFWQGGDSTNPTDFNTAANWSDSAVPTAGKNLIFSPLYNNGMTVNTDQGTTAFGDIIVQPGFTADIGTVTEPLKCVPGKFEYRGGGTIYIDLGSAAIVVVITGSGAYSSGRAGVNIIGDNISVLTISGGSCAIAFGAGDTATVTTARVSGSGRLIVGNGTTLTSLDVAGGSCDLRAGCETVKVYGGRLTTNEVAAISTKLTAYSGTLFLNGSGTIADLLLDGNASVDFTKNGIGRTVSTFQNMGGTITRDPSVITFSATTNADRVVRTSVQPI